MRTRRTETGAVTRLAPEAFYNAAFKILGEAGHEDLTVDALCARLNVTKGSFYHHFANTTEFVAGLLQCWEGTIEQYFAMTDTLKDDPAHMFEVMWTAAGVNRPYEAEGALRAWATSNPLVAATVRRVDTRIEAVIADWLATLLGDPARSRVLAFMWTPTIAGMQQRPRPLDRELILATTFEFLTTNLGIEAERDGDQLRISRMPGPP